ncbi:MAG: hypothetical protein V4696_03490 [Pseudomonadota bacterium]
MKDPSDANWHDAIGYTSIDQTVEFTFVRRIDDFLRKFEFVSDRV